MAEFLYYSYSRKPTGWEFFVPAGTKIMVKLLNGNSPSSFNFYLKIKILHDFTLIASVVGESVIGHGIGGNDNPSKIA